MILQKNDKSAFTLIEVLCVVGIIGILVGILMPTISMVKKSSLKAQTKAQFYEYIFALEGYFHEYGHYPYFFYEKDEINLTDFGEGFVKALSGHGGYPEYEELSIHERQKLNPKGITFYRFGRDEFNDQGLLVDAFGNSDIYIKVDTRKEGLLKIKGKKVAVRIGIYSQKKDGQMYEDIESWK